MKVDLYNHIFSKKTDRRSLLKGAAGVAALSATGGLGAMTVPAQAAGSLRADILKIPGVGKGSPTDADWQKVGEMCLGATKEVVKQG